MYRRKGSSRDKSDIKNKNEEERGEGGGGEGGLRARNGGEEMGVGRKEGRRKGERE